MNRLILTSLILMACATIAMAQDVAVMPTHNLRRGLNLSHWFSQHADLRGDLETRLQHVRTHTTAAEIAAIAAQGFDHVRLPIEPEYITLVERLGELDPQMMAEVDRAIAIILDAGLSVLVDCHPRDPLKTKVNDDDAAVDQAAAFWEAFARHLSSTDPQRVYLELMNEPKVRDVARWEAIQLKLVDAARRGAPRHTLILTGPDYSGRLSLMKIQPITDANVIYGFHYYNPMIFTHQGAKWGAPWKAGLHGVPYPARREKLEQLAADTQDPQAHEQLQLYGREEWDAAKFHQQMREIAQWARAHGIVITCSEFGVYGSYAPREDRLRYLRDVVAAFDAHHIPWTMWDFKHGFGAATSTDAGVQFDPQILTALSLDPTLSFKEPQP